MPLTDSAIGSLWMVWYCALTGSKYDSGIAGISVAGPTTWTGTVKVLVLPSSDSVPAGGLGGTLNLAAGSSSLPSDSVSRRLSLLTVTSRSTGSPSWTTERLAWVEIENELPTAPAKSAGRPDSGSGADVDRPGLVDRALRAGSGCGRRSPAGPTATLATTWAGGRSMCPAWRGVTSAVNSKRV